MSTEEKEIIDAATDSGATTESDSDAIHLTAVRIENIMSIEKREFRLGQCTIIEADNGEGKTSILTAIGAVFEGGKPANLIRDGADKGEVVLVFSNGMNVRKTFTPGGGGSLKITNDDGFTAPSPQSLLNGLTNGLKGDPSKFLAADKKERAKYLLEMMPVRLTDLHLAKLHDLGIDMKEREETDDLTFVRRASKSIYDNRTFINRDIKRNEGAIQTFKDNMPIGVLEEDWIARKKELVDELAKITSLLDEQLGEVTLTGIAERADISKAATAQRTRAEQDDRARLNSHTAEYNERLRKLQEWDKEQRQILTKEYDADKDAINAAERKALDEVNTDELAKSNDIRATLQPKIDQLNADLATAKEKAETAERVEGIRQNIVQLEEQTKGFQEDSERHTQMLEAIERIIGELTSSLPIKGLEVRDGDVWFKDPEQPDAEAHVWDRINTAKQIDLAVDICLESQGRLKLVRLDNLEHLSLATQTRMLRRLASKGASILGARVGDGPLKINHLTVN
jgi:hypothetical protein